MKLIYILSILLFVTEISVCSQSTVVTRYTPYGTDVAVDSVWEDDTPANRYNYDQNRASQYPDAVFYSTYPVIPGYSDLSSTKLFNCHGYAWHITSGDPSVTDYSDPVVMGDSKASKYFNDPSYKECVKADADIWWINGGSHSALATSTTDYLKSKWDDGPLAFHHKDQSPYTINTVTYYKKCYVEYTGAFGVDDTMNECAVQFENSSISNNVDLEIEYEDFVIIEGTFTTGTGATLYIHPD